MSVVGMSSPDAAATTLNARTLRMYEHYASEYALLIGDLPDPDRSQWLVRLRGAVGNGARVLEVGSGSGCDADYLESLGCHVRRTDATQAFVDIQSQRGHQADLLDVIADDLVLAGQPRYDAIVAMCVLVHVDRPLLPDVLAKILAALRPGGLFLVSMREGVGDEISSICFTSQWRPGEFERLSLDAGFVIEGTGRYEDCVGDVWRTLLCRREA
ncbi:methyltransferase [Kribbella sp. NPDC003505]|uniref:class I SAM-dependent methyltransferase n=1 Tax=Kribbella sp. NPDC003505 TaxID=3154448 RepID=UPI0033BF4292